MRNYGKVDPQFWTGDTGKVIRAGGPQVQVVALYLLTSPSATMIGVYYLPLPTLCYETGCSLETAREALQLLNQADFANYDERSEHVWIPNMARFQIGESMQPGDKRVRHVINLLTALARRKIPFVETFLERYQQAFHLNLPSPLDAPSKPLVSPIEARSRSRNKSRKSGTGERDVASAVAHEFEEFWSLYPMRNGKRLGKPDALTKFKRLKNTDRALVFNATKNYAASELVQKGLGIKDAHRWLCSGNGIEPWRDWIEPEQRTSKELHDGADALPRTGFTERNYRDGAF